MKLNNQYVLTSTLISGLIFFCSNVAAAELVKLNVKVQKELRNADVSFKKGAVGSIGVKVVDFNGIVAETAVLMEKYYRYI
jgi:hypothetical protein